MMNLNLKLNKKLQKIFGSNFDEMIESKLHKRIKDFQENQEIWDILYFHSPYYKRNMIGNIFTTIWFIIILGASLYLPFMRFYPNESIFAILVVSIMLFFLLFAAFIYPFFAYPFHDSWHYVNFKLFDNKRLDSALLEIKRRGLYPQFLNNSLFNPISNPHHPIYYNEIKHMFKKQTRIMKKIIKDASIMKNRMKTEHIMQEQKAYIDKYR